MSDDLSDEYQLADPSDCGLWIVQAAVLLGIPSIDVATGLSSVTFTLEGAIPEAWLDEPLGGLTVTPDTAEREAWRDFSVALNSALGSGVGASMIQVTCGENVVRVDLEGDTLVRGGASGERTAILIRRLGWQQIGLFLGSETVAIVLGGYYSHDPVNCLILVSIIGVVAAVRLRGAFLNLDIGRRIDPMAVRFSVRGKVATVEPAYETTLGSLTCSLQPLLSDESPSDEWQLPEGSVSVVWHGVKYPLNLGSPIRGLDISAHPDKLPTDRCGQPALARCTEDVQAEIYRVSPTFWPRLLRDFATDPDADLAAWIAVLGFYEPVFRADALVALAPVASETFRSNVVFSYFYDKLTRG